MHQSIIIIIIIIIRYRYCTPRGLVCTCTAAEPSSPCARSQAAPTDKKAGFSYLKPGCRDTSSFCGIIPVKAGWLVYRSDLSARLMVVRSEHFMNDALMSYQWMYGTVFHGYIEMPKQGLIMTPIQGVCKNTYWYFKRRLYVVSGTQTRGKEGLRDRLGWKCTLSPECRPGAHPIAF